MPIKRLPAMVSLARKKSKALAKRPRETKSLRTGVKVALGVGAILGSGQLAHSRRKKHNK